ITNSNTQVQGGVELVSKAGTALAEIVDSINQVAAIVADIASASQEQATGIEQINKALTQMDEVTQQNPAMVEENAATGKTTDQQAGAMSGRVSFFRVDDDAGPQVAVAAAGGPALTTMPTQRSPATTKAQRVSPVPPRTRAVANGGPVNRMQSALAAAVNA